MGEDNVIELMRARIDASIESNLEDYYGCTHFAEAEANPKLNVRTLTDTTPPFRDGRAIRKTSTARSARKATTDIGSNKPTAT